MSARKGPRRDATAAAPSDVKEDLNSPALPPRITSSLFASTHDNLSSYISPPFHLKRPQSLFLHSIATAAPASAQSSVLINENEASLASSAQDAPPPHHGPSGDLHDVDGSDDGEDAYCGRGAGSLGVRPDGSSAEDPHQTSTSRNVSHAPKERPSHEMKDKPFHSSSGTGGSRSLALMGTQTQCMTVSTRRLQLLCFVLAELSSASTLLEDYTRGMLNIAHRLVAAWQAAMVAAAAKHKCDYWLKVAAAEKVRRFLKRQRQRQPPPPPPQQQRYRKANAASSASASAISKKWRTTRRHGTNVCHSSPMSSCRSSMSSLPNAEEEEEEEEIVEAGAKSKIHAVNSARGTQETSSTSPHNISLTSSNLQLEKGRKRRPLPTHTRHSRTHGLSATTSSLRQGKLLQQLHQQHATYDHSHIPRRLRHAFSHCRHREDAVATHVESLRRVIVNALFQQFLNVAVDVSINDLVLYHWLRRGAKKTEMASDLSEMTAAEQQVLQELQQHSQERREEGKNGERTRERSTGATCEFSNIVGDKGNRETQEVQRSTPPPSMSRDRCNEAFNANVLSSTIATEGKVTSNISSSSSPVRQHRGEEEEEEKKRRDRDAGGSSWVMTPCCDEEEEEEKREKVKSATNGVQESAAVKIEPIALLTDGDEAESGNRHAYIGRATQLCTQMHDTDTLLTPPFQSFFACPTPRSRIQKGAGLARSGKESASTPSPNQRQLSRCVGEEDPGSVPSPCYGVTGSCTHSQSAGLSVYPRSSCSMPESFSHLQLLQQQHSTLSSGSKGPSSGFTPVPMGHGVRPGTHGGRYNRSSNVRSSDETTVADLSDAITAARLRSSANALKPSQLASDMELPRHGAAGSDSSLTRSLQQSVTLTSSQVRLLRGLRREMQTTEDRFRDLSDIDEGEGVCDDDEGDSVKASAKDRDASLNDTRLENAEEEQKTRIYIDTSTAATAAATNLRDQDSCLGLKRARAEDSSAVGSAETNASFNEHGMCTNTEGTASTAASPSVSNISKNTQEIDKAASRQRMQQQQRSSTAGKARNHTSEDETASAAPASSPEDAFGMDINAPAPTIPMRYFMQTASTLSPTVCALSLMSRCILYARHVCDRDDESPPLADNDYRAFCDRTYGSLENNEDVMQQRRNDDANVDGTKVGMEKKGVTPQLQEQEHEGWFYVVIANRAVGACEHAQVCFGNRKFIFVACQADSADSGSGGEIYAPHLSRTSSTTGGARSSPTRQRSALQFLCGPQYVNARTRDGSPFMGNFKSPTVLQDSFSNEDDRHNPSLDPVWSLHVPEFIVMHSSYCTADLQAAASQELGSPFLPPGSTAANTQYLIANDRGAITNTARSDDNDGLTPAGPLHPFMLSSFEQTILMPVDSGHDVDGYLTSMRAALPCGSRTVTAFASASAASAITSVKSAGGNISAKVSETDTAMEHTASVRPATLEYKDVEGNEEEEAQARQEARGPGTAGTSAATATAETQAHYDVEEDTSPTDGDMSFAMELFARLHFWCLRGQVRDSFLAENSAVEEEDDDDKFHEVKTGVTVDKGDDFSASRFAMNATASKSEEVVEEEGREGKTRERSELEDGANDNAAANIDETAVRITLPLKLLYADVGEITFEAQEEEESREDGGGGARKPSAPYPPIEATANFRGQQLLFEALLGSTEVVVCAARESRSHSGCHDLLHTGMPLGPGAMYSYRSTASPTRWGTDNSRADMEAMGTLSDDESNPFAFDRYEHLAVQGSVRWNRGGTAETAATKASQEHKSSSSSRQCTRATPHGMNKNCDSCNRHGGTSTHGIDEDEEEEARRAATSWYTYKTLSPYEERLRRTERLKNEFRLARSSRLDALLVDSVQCKPIAALIFEQFHIPAVGSIDAAGVGGTEAVKSSRFILTSFSFYISPLWNYLRQGKMVLVDMDRTIVDNAVTPLPEEQMRRQLFDMKQQAQHQGGKRPSSRARSLGSEDAEKNRGVTTEGRETSKAREQHSRGCHDGSSCRCVESRRHRRARGEVVKYHSAYRDVVALVEDGIAERDPATAKSTQQQQQQEQEHKLESDNEAADTQGKKQCDIDTSISRFYSVHYDVSYPITYYVGKGSAGAVPDTTQPPCSEVIYVRPGMREFLYTVSIQWGIPLVLVTKSTRLRTEAILSQVLDPYHILFPDYKQHVVAVDQLSRMARSFHEGDDKDSGNCDVTSGLLGPLKADGGGGGGEDTSHGVWAQTRQRRRQLMESKKSACDVIRLYDGFHTFCSRDEMRRAVLATALSRTARGITARSAGGGLDGKTTDILRVFAFGRSRYAKRTSPRSGIVRSVAIIDDAPQVWIEQDWPSTVPVAPYTLSRVDPRAYLDPNGLVGSLVLSCLYGARCFVCPSLFLEPSQEQKGQQKADETVSREDVTTLRWPHCVCCCPPSHRIHAVPHSLTAGSFNPGMVGAALTNERDTGVTLRAASPLVEEEEEGGEAEATRDYGEILRDPLRAEKSSRLPHFVSRDISFPNGAHRRFKLGDTIVEPVTTSSSSPFSRSTGSRSTSSRSTGSRSTSSRSTSSFSTSTASTVDGYGEWGSGAVEEEAKEEETVDASDGIAPMRQLDTSTAHATSDHRAQGAPRRDQDRAGPQLSQLLDSDDAYSFQTNSTQGARDGDGDSDRVAVVAGPQNEKCSGAASSRSKHVSSNDNRDSPLLLRQHADRHHQRHHRHTYHHYCREQEPPHTPNSFLLSKMGESALLNSSYGCQHSYQFPSPHQSLITTIPVVEETNGGYGREEDSEQQQQFAYVQPHPFQQDAAGSSHTAARHQGSSEVEEEEEGGRKIALLSQNPVGDGEDMQQLVTAMRPVSTAWWTGDVEDVTPVIVPSTGSDVCTTDLHAGSSVTKSDDVTAAVADTCRTSAGNHDPSVQCSNTEQSNDDVNRTPQHKGQWAVEDVEDVVPL